MTLICLNPNSKIYLINHLISSSLKNLSGLDFIWARDGRSSCIDHVLFNCKKKEYINKVSLYSTFNDISDHFPLILSCTKDDSEGFREFSPPEERTDTDSLDNTNTEIITRNNGRGVIIEE